MFQMASKVDYPISFGSENKLLNVLLNYPEVTCPLDQLNKAKHKVTYKTQNYFLRLPVLWACTSNDSYLLKTKNCAKKEIDELLEAGIINCSNFPFASALHMMPKSSAHFQVMCRLSPD